ncbi:MAG: ribosome silencing factor [Rhodospirillales bacterium]
MLAEVQKTLDDDKAQDIVVIDLDGKTSMGDYMVIATGTSQRQVGAMADHLQENLKASGVSGVTAEGTANCDWVLIDAGDIIVHLFRPEVRSFYNLEKIWNVPSQVSGHLAGSGSERSSAEVAGASA